MPRTVTIEVPDEFSPLLDKVLARWIAIGKVPELTLWNMLRHGIEFMDGPDPSKPWDVHGHSGDDMGDDLPF